MNFVKERQTAAEKEHREFYTTTSTLGGNESDVAIE